MNTGAGNAGARAAVVPGGLNMRGEPPALAVPERRRRQLAYELLWCFRVVAVAT
jgi:hypothetical protein